jgi:hypothetical protein
MARWNRIRTIDAKKALNAGRDISLNQLQWIRNLPTVLLNREFTSDFAAWSA